MQKREKKKKGKKEKKKDEVETLSVKVRVQRHIILCVIKIATGCKPVFDKVCKSNRHLLE